MIAFRNILSVYRTFLNFVFKKNTQAVMSPGALCSIPDFQSEKYRGDLVHPCVKYTEKPFSGSQWWLVYTPYYNANPYIENPILCSGISANDEGPLKWSFEKLIRDTPTKGYNSDPTMFFSSEGLNIFWRENETERTHKDKVFRATYGLILTQEGVVNIENPVLEEKDQFRDREVSPTFIRFKDGYRAYAADLRFKDRNLHFRNGILEKIFSKILWLLSLLEVYHEQKSYGIAIWESLHINDRFNYIKTVKISNCNKLYRPWHFDFFEFEEKLYALVQTNQCNADICLAVSEDFENFRMYSKPLITNKSIGKMGIYKPTGFVYNKVFYLYYTAQDENNRVKNNLYRTEIPMVDLLNLLEA